MPPPRRASGRRRRAHKSERALHFCRQSQETAAAADGACAAAASARSRSPGLSTSPRRRQDWAAAPAATRRLTSATSPAASGRIGRHTSALRQSTQRRPRSEPCSSSRRRIQQVAQLDLASACTSSRRHGQARRPRAHARVAGRLPPPATSRLQGSDGSQACAAAPPAWQGCNMSGWRLSPSIDVAGVRCGSCPASSDAWYRFQIAVERFHRLSRA